MEVPPCNNRSSRDACTTLRVATKRGRRALWVRDPVILARCDVISHRQTFRGSGRDHSPRSASTIPTTAWPLRQWQRPGSYHLAETGNFLWPAPPADSVRIQARLMSETRLRLCSKATLRKERRERASSIVLAQILQRLSAPGSLAAATGWESCLGIDLSIENAVAAPEVACLHPAGARPSSPNRFSMSTATRIDPQCEHFAIDTGPYPTDVVDGVSRKPGRGCSASIGSARCCSRKTSFPISRRPRYRSRHDLIGALPRAPGFQHRQCLSRHG
ncbi:hypothetical protein ABID59_007392 [Bradyrhizobium sp. S3.3.6]